MEKINNKNIIMEFWVWFSEICSSFGDSYENEQLLDELDLRVSQLGDFVWEIGPGKVKQNQFVISPGGDEDLLKFTKEIVSTAIENNEWEFYYAKQIKDWNFNFDYELDDGSLIEIDAANWTYILLRYQGGKYEIIFKAEISNNLNEEDRIAIGEILLDGTIGEELRILYFVGVELVETFDAIYFGKEKKIESLLETIISSR